MKLQKQLFPDHNPDEGKFGDCYRTCIAILLDMDAADVPHFARLESTHEWSREKTNEVVREWLAERGYSMLSFVIHATFVGIDKWVTEATGGVPYILTSQSNKYKDVCHCTIATGAFEPVWCPQAGRAVKQEPWYDEEVDAHFFGIEMLVRGPGSVLCSVPPEGWYCTRPAGHDGPCAAHPNKDYNQ